MKVEADSNVKRICEPGREYWMASGRVYDVDVKAEGKTRAEALRAWLEAATKRIGDDGL